MRNVGRAYANNTRMHFGKHFRAIVIGVRDTVAHRCLLGALHAAVKDGYDFGVVCTVFPGGYVTGVGNHTRTDHGDF